MDHYLLDLTRTATKKTGVRQAQPKFLGRARYHPAMDMMLYLTRDEEYVAERVDHYLTLLWEGREGGDLIGLKLKGFRHIFLTIKAENPVIGEAHFLPLITVLQEFLTSGHAREIMDDPARKAKYDQAVELARWGLMVVSEDIQLAA